jgi:hypothetical protein
MKRARNILIVSALFASIYLFAGDPLAWLAATAIYVGILYGITYAVIGIRALVRKVRHHGAYG